jgi:hypothetical protein
LFVLAPGVDGRSCLLGSLLTRLLPLPVSILRIVFSSGVDAPWLPLPLVGLRHGVLILPAPLGRDPEPLGIVAVPFLSPCVIEPAAFQLLLEGRAVDTKAVRGLVEVVVPVVGHGQAVLAAARSIATRLSLGLTIPRGRLQAGLVLVLVDEALFLVLRLGLVL